MLVDSTKLAKTSGTPGKTQLINFFEIESYAPLKSKPSEKWWLVDLPGYGFAKIAQSTRRRWEQMIENYLRKRETLTNVFLLIDARHSPQKIDIEFVNKLGDWNIPFSLVFTKSDKEKPGAVQRNVKAFLNAMLETFQFLPQHFVTSAEKRLGKEGILDLIDETNQNLKEESE